MCEKWATPAKIMCSQRAAPPAVAAFSIRKPLRPKDFCPKVMKRWARWHPVCFSIGWLMVLDPPFFEES
jgi:hypothetical protein